MTSFVAFYLWEPMVNLSQVFKECVLCGWMENRCTKLTLFFLYVLYPTAESVQLGAVCQHLKP